MTDVENPESGPLGRFIRAFGYDARRDGEPQRRPRRPGPDRTVHRPRCALVGARCRRPYGRPPGPRGGAQHHPSGARYDRRHFRAQRDGLVETGSHVAASIAWSAEKDVPRASRGGTLGLRGATAAKSKDWPQFRIRRNRRRPVFWGEDSRNTSVVGSAGPSPPRAAPRFGLVVHGHVPATRSQPLRSLWISVGLRAIARKAGWPQGAGKARTVTACNAVRHGNKPSRTTAEAKIGLARFPDTQLPFVGGGRRLGAPQAKRSARQRAGRPAPA